MRATYMARFMEKEVNGNDTDSLIMYEAQNGGGKFRLSLLNGMNTINCFKDVGKV